MTFALGWEGYLGATEALNTIDKVLSYRVRTLQGGRLSKLPSVVNTDFGRTKGRNYRILVVKKNTCLCSGVLK